jgi:hypothetical protein
MSLAALDETPEPSIVAKLRHLAVGAELHSKGARFFSVHLRPFGVVVVARDRSLIRVITSSTMIPFDKLEDDLENGRVKAILNEIDAALDREIRRAE